MHQSRGFASRSALATAAGPTPIPVGRMIAVGEGHEIFVEETGSPDGLPVVFLHGGPGSGCQPSCRSLFDFAVHRAVLIDQRGAGRSRPHGRREANTTAHLIGDLERVRETLGIERWLVVGGSWGATLALTYAETHPERVSGLVLRSVFLGTRAELDWAFIEAPQRFRPDLYRFFIDALPPSERRDPLDAYFRRILDPDPAVHGPAAWAWHDAERVLSELLPAAAVPVTSRESGDARLPATPFMEAHYFSNGCFLESDQLLRDARALAGIPGIIIQGRYDMLCPPSSAASLADRWPDARVVFIEGAGHSISEPGVTRAMAAAIATLSAPPQRARDA